MADETDDDDARTHPRKVREGIVVSTKMDKTVVVAVVDRVRHRRYGKTLQRTTQALRARRGERRPRGRPCAHRRDAARCRSQKRWRVVEVLERAR